MSRHTIPSDEIISDKELAYKLFTLTVSACPYRNDRAQLTRLFNEGEKSFGYHTIALQFNYILSIGLYFDRWSQYEDDPKNPPAKTKDKADGDKTIFPEDRRKR